MEEYRYDGTDFTKKIKKLFLFGTLQKKLKWYTILEMVMRNNII